MRQVTGRVVRDQRSFCCILCGRNQDVLHVISALCVTIIWQVAGHVAGDKRSVCCILCGR